MNENVTETIKKEIKEYADAKLIELSQNYKFSLNSEKIFWYERIDDFNIRNDLEYNVYLLLCKSTIDEWYEDLKERLDNYDKMYSKGSSQKNVLDYETLIQEVNNKIPEKYKNKPVKEHYFSYGHFSPSYYAFHPFPSYCAFIDKKTGGKLICSKGEVYIIEKLYEINKYKDFDNIAPLFILVVLSDFGEYLQNDYIDHKTINNFIIQSRHLLIRNGYGKPDYRYKRFVISLEDEAFDFFQNMDYKKIKTEKELAFFIVTLLELTYQPYDMEYFLMSEDEKKRALDNLRKIISGDIENG